MKAIQVEYYHTRESNTVDAESLGLHGVALLGKSRFLRTREPVVEHIHRGMLEVGFCLRSPLALNVNGDEFPVTPGWFFVNQPNVPHRLTSRPNGLYVYYFLIRRPTTEKTLLDLPEDESTAIWKRLRGLPPTLPTGARAGQVRELFTRLFRLCEEPRAPLTSVKLRQTFLNLVVLILELAEQPSDISCSGSIEKIVDLIRANPERPFTVDELAQEAALSPTHFINQFRRTTGFPPIRFQIECRIQQAKQLLRETSMTASAIAIRLGFNSLQHFSDTFTRVTGMSPNRWRSAENYTIMQTGRPA